MSEYGTMFHYQSWGDIGKEGVSKVLLPPVELPYLVRDSGRSLVGKYFTDIAVNEVREGMLFGFCKLEIAAF